MLSTTFMNSAGANKGSSSLGAVASLQMVLGKVRGSF
jgi:hypothetical protein